MATRMIFMLNPDGIKEILIDFKYYSGFSVTQKQKSILSLHEEIRKYSSKNVLEVSSKSPNQLGENLSAFNLNVTINGKKIALENFFQASKVFEYGGPYIDLLNVSPIEAKKDDRLRTSGKLIAFRYKNKDFPTEPKTLYYDWIYCRALNHYKEYISELLKYEVFTDIEFNHEKSINCQARSVAIYMFLYKKGVLKEALSRIDSFKKYAYQDYEDINSFD